ncbi:MAG: hypothetical protein MR266_00965 [Erysipelotrichaceae bacterium]|nr:hypothetical protein [Erysipelotrichaceae bacterium]
MEKLNENEKEVFQKLFDLNKKIYKLYENLINSKNQEEYNKNKSYFVICLEIEDELYKKLDFSNIRNYVNYINNDFISKISDYDITISNFYEFALLKRTYNKLILKGRDIDIQYIESENDLQEELEKSRVNLIFSTVLDVDFKNLYIFFLNDWIKKLRNEKIKKKLKKAMYLMYFLNPNLEKDFLENDKPNNYISSYFSKDISNITDTSFKKLLSMYETKYLKKYFNLLFNIKDSEYDKEDNALKILLYDSLIKSCLEMHNIKLNYDKAKTSDNDISIHMFENIIKNRNTYGIIKLKTEGITYESSK